MKLGRTGRSVSGTYLGWHMEYWVMNNIDGLRHQREHVVYARTKAEAERKAAKCLASLPEAVLHKMWCLDKPVTARQRREAREVD